MNREQELIEEISELVSDIRHYVSREKLEGVLDGVQLVKELLDELLEAIEKEKKV